MDHDGQVDVIYSDFEKAFDCEGHIILLNKLATLGIKWNLDRRTESYLGNRSEAVALSGYRSDFVTTPNGVPQGSHSGPLLYNAYIYL